MGCYEHWLARHDDDDDEEDGDDRSLTWACMCVVDGVVVGMVT